MNIRKGRANFKRFRILLHNGFSSTIVTRRQFEKLHPGKKVVIQWQTQDGNITTNFKVRVDFTLPTLSATNVVTWKCHVYDSSKGSYEIILGRYLLTE